MRDLPSLPPLAELESRTAGRHAATAGAGAVLESPTAASSHLSQSDLANALAPVSLPSLRAGGGEEKQFLSYERRGLWGQAAYNVGYSYFSGIAVGGSIGFVRGLRTSPNAHPRVLLNSVLNGSGKFGARAGNALGVLAMLYTGARALLLRGRPQPLHAHPRACSRRETRGGHGGGQAAVAARTRRRHRRGAARARRGDARPRLGRICHRGALLAAQGLCVGAGPAALWSPLSPPSPPPAVTMRGLEKQYITLPKRVAVVGLGGALTVLGVGVMSVVGPLVFGNKSPFRFV